MLRSINLTAHVIQNLSEPYKMSHILQYLFAKYLKIVFVWTLELEIIKRSQVLPNLNIPGISMADPMLPVLPGLVLVSQSVYDTCSNYGNLADTSIDFLSL